MDIAACLNNLGRYYLNLENFIKAENCFLESLCIKEKILGK